jgi:hypothetical protein
MPRVVVVGGGWAGCAAAIAAARSGAGVTLLERTDALLGTGRAGGIMENNGRLTGALEARALGAGDMFDLAAAAYRHRGVDFPGHDHAALYDPARLEGRVLSALPARGVEVRLLARAVGVEMAGRRVLAVTVERAAAVERGAAVERATADGDAVGRGGHVVGPAHPFARAVAVPGSLAAVYADAFVDATGTAGPPALCRRWGNGCVMCVMRCPTFGPRVSVAARAGIEEFALAGEDGRRGAMSGSCKLERETVAPEVTRALGRGGVAVLPLPPELRHAGALAIKACRQYALPEYAESLVLLDTGAVKMMTPFFPRAELRQVPGLEAAQYVDPIAGGVGNSMRFLALLARDDGLRVLGTDNLFSAGEKVGLVGHTEAALSGALAGHNAVRAALGLPALVLPPALAVGDLIAASGREARKEREYSRRYTLSGDHYFLRLRGLGLYLTSPAEVAARVAGLGLAGALAAPPRRAGGGANRRGS